MELNKALLKIQYLLEQRNWTLYKLAKETGIPYSSLNSLFIKNNHPTLTTLEKICDGFHISMSEFFSEETPYRIETGIVSDEEQELLNNFRQLSRKDRRKYLQILNILKDN